MRPDDFVQPDEAIDIVAFRPGDGPVFRALNEEWLKAHFTVEPADDVMLGDPQGEILDRGGSIFFIRTNGRIVGTVALIKLGDTAFELAKMAVTASAQGHGLGKRLLEHAIAVAAQKEARKLVLHTSRKLLPALHLYYQHGFVQVPLGESEFERADIRMERMLVA